MKPSIKDKLIKALRGGRSIYAIGGSVYGYLGAGRELICSTTDLLAYRDILGLMRVDSGGSPRWVSLGLKTNKRGEQI